MALFDFLGDLFGGDTAPQPVTSTQSMQSVLPSLIGMIPGIAGANLSAAQTTVPGAVNLWNQTQNQLNPQYGDIKDKVATRILSDLGLGYNLPQDVMEQIMRQSLGGAMRSGFAGPAGISEGGRGLTARDLGLSSIDWQQGNVNRAQQWMGQQDPFRIASEMPQALNLGQVAGIGAQDAATQNDYQSYLANQQRADVQTGLGSILSLLGLGTGAARVAALF